MFNRRRELFEDSRHVTGILLTDIKLEQNIMFLRFSNGELLSFSTASFTLKIFVYLSNVISDVRFMYIQNIELYLPEMVYISNSLYVA